VSGVTDFDADFPWGWSPPLVWHHCTPYEPNDRCGGCDECLQMQHEYYRLLEKEQTNA
jgi:hypothetical protein